MLFGGGTDGNEQLTAMTGVLLLALLAVIGITILRMRQLISVHLFVGLLLIGPVCVKMSSTGYRFARYYLRNRAYRTKGAPELAFRLIAPVVVLSTVIVFGSGIALLVTGPAGRGQWLEIHKVSFIVWVVFTALHVLGHLPGLADSLRATRTRQQLLGAEPGGSGRWLALGGAVLGGAVLAVVLIPDFAAWTAHGVFVHHHHHG